MHSVGSKELRSNASKMTSTHLRLSLFVVCLVAVSVSGVSDPGLSKSCAHTRSTFESITLQDQNGASRSLTGRVFEELQSGTVAIKCILLKERVTFLQD